MKETEIVIPRLGESVTSASVVKWLKKPGENVKADEPVMDIATDKVDTEVLAPCDGVLVKQLVSEGEEVAIGHVIGFISAGDGEVAAATGEAEVRKEPDPEACNPSLQLAEAGNPALRSGFYSPLVRKIAEKEGISATELNSIKGSGANGRVNKVDVFHYLDNRKEMPADARQDAPVRKAAVGTGVPEVPLMPGDEILEMDRMRLMIAEHMVRSKHVAPHVTAFAEADMTNLVLWRNRVKKAFEQQNGEKLTFTPLILEAMVRAIKDMPLINAAVNAEGTKIIKRKAINIGMATALPSGNLIVPVIKNADDRNLLGLAREVNRLAANARNNKLLPDEVQGGTITLSNVGVFGNIAGTPIINQPQAAILAVGTITKKPAVVETPQGDMIAIRHKMILSLSFDHRVVDGSLGGVFVKRVADYLENWDMNHEY